MELLNFLLIFLFIGATPRLPLMNSNQISVISCYNKHPSQHLHLSHMAHACCLLLVSLLPNTQCHIRLQVYMSFYKIFPSPEWQIPYNAPLTCHQFPHPKRILFQNNIDSPPFCSTIAPKKKFNTLWNNVISALMKSSTFRITKLALSIYYPCFT